MSHLLAAGEDVLVAVAAKGREDRVTHLIVTSQRLIAVRSTLLVGSRAWGIDRARIDSASWSALPRGRTLLRVTQDDGSVSEFELADSDREAVAAAMVAAVDALEPAVATIWSAGPSRERLEIWPDRLRWQGDFRRLDSRVRARVTSVAGFSGDPGGGIVDASFHVVHPSWRVVVPIAPTQLGEASAIADQVNLICETVGSSAASTSSVDLGDVSAAMSPAEVRERSPRSAGLYSWWVDAAGAADLSAGLGVPVEPGLIYVGKASGSLRSRLAGQHLGPRARSSTLRRTLLAALRPALGELDEAELSTWMHRHLRVVAAPLEVDAAALSAAEDEALLTLDPPLNLKGMRSSPVRQRLKALRREARQAT
jgi:hypothetical protein